MARKSRWKNLLVGSKRGKNKSRGRKKYAGKRVTAESLEPRRMLAAYVSMYGEGGITEPGYSVGEQDWSMTVPIYAYPDDYENGGQGPVSVRLEISGTASADDIKLEYEDEELEIIGGQVTFDAEFEGDLKITALSDAELEGKEKLVISLAESPNYQGSGEISAYIYDSSYSATLIDKTPADQSGSTITEDCGCGFQAIIHQSGTIYLLFEVEVDAEGSLLVDPTLSGTFGENKFGGSQLVDIDPNDSEPEKATFIFAFDRSQFPSDDLSAKFQVTLDTSPGFNVRADGPTTLEGRVFFGKNDVIISPIPFLE